MSEYCIYRHMAPNGKSYIGQTKNYKKRCVEHKLDSLKDNPPCRLFARAIKKYKWDNFTHEILESGLTLEEANRKEEIYIRIYNSLSPNGYNLNTGGLNRKVSEETRQKIKEVNLGRKISDETRIKISEAGKGRIVSDETRAKLKGNKGRTGIKHSEERKKQISEFMKGHSYNKGRKHSEERKKQISEFMKGNNWNIGKTQSEESNKKRSETLKGRVISDETRAKMCLAQKGRTFSDETKRKMSESAKKRCERERMNKIKVRPV